MTQLLEALEESRALGFLGPGPVEPHLDHANAFAAAVETEPARALDLGAGGGLPGLVLAVEHWPQTRWTFLDAQAKRTAFLQRMVDQLGLADRVEIVTERAETVAQSVDHRARYDLVTARSFAAPAVTAECAAGFLVDGGQLVVSEPPDVTNRWPTAGIALFGFEPAEPLVVDAGARPAHLVRMTRRGPLAASIPRRVGMPGKRPRF